jgi:asparagine N-glycosylation enzyme membrane subunit Stt3
MFQRMIDELKDTVATSVRLTSLAAGMAVALFITIAFLCAAAFVYVLQSYGLIQACLTGAAVFFVVTLIVAIIYMVRRKRTPTRATESAKSAVHSALADPMLVATGIQLVRAIGIKRLVPILAIGGLALGILASRANSDEEEAPDT